MTGTTSVRSPAPTVNKLVQRDPAAYTQEGGVVIKPSYSTESEEPFDQRTESTPITETAAMRPTQNDTYLDDGDLPSLSKSESKPSDTLLNGKRTTMRPLHLPSNLGVVTPENAEQRKFWSQLDPDVPDERRSGREDDEMPDDEMEARRLYTSSSRQREINNARRQGDEYMEDEYTSSLGNTRTYGSQETEQASDERGADATFCGQTLTALGDMCGTLLSANSADNVEPPRRHSAPPNRPRLSSKPPSSKPDDENTAIEVEFVEQSGSLSPQMKNSYLTAMALKAKEDFEKRKETKLEAKTVPHAISNAAHDANDDIYRSFNTTEKRKFLKLINSGLSPSQATHHVLEEREAVKRQVEKPVPTPAPVTPIVTSIPRTAVVQKPVETPTVQPTATPPLSEEKPLVDRQKRMSRAARLAFWKKSRSQSVESHQRSAQGNDDDKVKKQILMSSSSPGTETISSPVQHESGTPATEQSETPASKGEHESDDESSTRFLKSGINYYDGVRKDDDDQSIENSPQMLKATESRNKKGHFASKTGFYALKDRRAQSAPPDRPLVTPPRPEKVALQNTPELAQTADFISVSREVPKLTLARVDRGGTKLEGASEAPIQQSKLVTPDRSVAREGSNYSVLGGVQGASSLDTQVINLDPRSTESSRQNSVTAPKANEVAHFDSRDGSRAKTTTTNNEVTSNRLSGNQIATPVSSHPIASLAKQKTDVAYSERDSMINPKAMKASDPLQPSQPYAAQNSQSVVPKNNEAASRTVADLLSKLEQYDDTDVQEQAALDKIAEGLLRPVSVTSTESVKTLQYDNASSSPPATTQPITSVQAKNPKEESVHFDSMLEVSMDTYMHSTESYAQGAQNDAMSVYTLGTGVTGTSTYTQSSRVRRPGAAKMRLASTRNAETKPLGWHESMKAAAAATNHVWNPKTGWVGYEEPQFEEPLPKSKEKIHIDLIKPLQSNKALTADERTVGGEKAAVVVPFPPDWERERDDMIKSTFNESPPGKNIEFGESSQDPKKPRGWVESMRAATAALGKDGTAWDPVTGWTLNNAEDQNRIADVVDFASPSPLTVQGIAGGQVKQLESEREGQTLAYHETDMKLNQWIAKVEQAPKNRSELSTESSDKAVASSGPVGERYVQLSDGGSIRSIPMGKQQPLHRPIQDSLRKQSTPIGSLNQEKSYISDDDTEDENSPLLDTSGAFPSLNDGAPVAGAVTVVREKVGEEDIALFPKEQVKQRRSNSLVKRPHEESRESSKANIPSGEEVEMHVNRGKTTNSSEVIISSTRQGRDVGAKGSQDPQRLANTTDSSSVMSTPSRRGRGPVDIDEVDESWDSDEDQRNSRSAMGSVSATSLTTKNIPKLKPNKRDTSPVSGRLSKSRSEEISTASEPRDNTDHSKPTPLPQKTSDEEAKKRYVSQTSAKTPFREKSLTPEGSSIVKESIQIWESRSQDLSDSHDPIQDGKHSNEQGEWKSFLGKKIRDEIAPSRRHEEPDDYIWEQGLSSTGVLEGSKYSARLSSTAKRQTESELDFGAMSPGMPALRNAAVSSTDRIAGQHTQETKTALLSNVPSHLSSHARTLESDLSDLSPIRAEEDLAETEDKESAYGPLPGERNSFFKRLSECASPMMSNSGGVPTAHLAFLRSGQQATAAREPSGRFVPPSFCGRPDVVDEDDRSSVVSGSQATRDDQSKPDEGHHRISRSGERPRAKSTPRALSRDRSTNSSVASEDFGAKTAYLEAIAMKTAVSRPRSSSKRRHSSSASSVVSSSSTHSEKWKSFVERKKASGTPLTSRGSDSSQVSKAAEKYAAEKVEEMMSMMANRPGSAPRLGGYDLDAMMNNSVMSEPPTSSNQSLDATVRRAESVKAAEDLASARVEAMMAALANAQYLDEAEI